MASVLTGRIINIEEQSRAALRDMKISMYGVRARVVRAERSRAETHTPTYWVRVTCGWPSLSLRFRFE